MGKCFSACRTSSSSEEPHNGKKSTSQLPPKTVQQEISPGRVGQHPHYAQRNDTSSLRGSITRHRQPAVDVNNGSQSRPSTENSRQFPHHNGVESTAAMKSDFSEKKANKLFEKYRDSSEDAILAEGTERFCQDLQVSPDDFIVLLIAWKFQAATMCRFTRGEFVQGCRTLRADSISGIKSKFPEMRSEVQSNDTLFKDLYRYTFGFGLDMEGGQRTLPCEIAIPLWELVFHYRQPPILHRWCNFLTENQIKGISRDTWQMFLHFVEVIGDNLSNYDDNEAWPSLFDSFVEYENDRLKGEEEPAGSGDDPEESHLV